MTIDALQLDLGSSTWPWQFKLFQRIFHNFPAFQCCQQHPATPGHQVSGSVRCRLHPLWFKKARDGPIDIWYIIYIYIYIIIYIYIYIYISKILMNETIGSSPITSSINGWVFLFDNPALAGDLIYRNSREASLCWESRQILLAAWRLQSQDV